MMWISGPKCFHECCENSNSNGNRSGNDILLGSVRGRNGGSDCAVYRVLESFHPTPAANQNPQLPGTALVTMKIVCNID